MLFAACRKERAFLTVTINQGVTRDLLKAQRVARNEVLVAVMRTLRKPMSERAPSLHEDLDGSSERGFRQHTGIYLAIREQNAGVGEAATLGPCPRRCGAGTDPGVTLPGCLTGH